MKNKIQLSCLWLDSTQFYLGKSYGVESILENGILTQLLANHFDLKHQNEFEFEFLSKFIVY